MSRNNEHPDESEKNEPNDLDTFHNTGVAVSRWISRMFQRPQGGATSQQQVGDQEVTRPKTT